MNIYIIHLPKDKERYAFQTWQCRRLGLTPTWIDATSLQDISEIERATHRHRWERPLRDVEIACYLSHYRLWSRIVQENKPAVILEDDALLSDRFADIIRIAKTLNGIDFINLETVGRKKILRNKPIGLDNDHAIYPLLLDRNGNGGYILYPSGAAKLIDHHERYGAALADAHIRRSNLNAYQLEPASVIQADQCHRFGLHPPFAAVSNIGTQTKPSSHGLQRWRFFLRRLRSQLRQAWQHTCLLYGRCTKRYINVDPKAFDHTQEYADATR